jgi:large subunit ribosomal protein L15
MPLSRRLPKVKGFKPISRVPYQIVNLSRLSRFVPADTSDVTPAVLRDLGLVSSARRPVKILGDGTIRRPLHISAHKFSESARTAIEAAGGKVTLLQK